MGAWFDSMQGRFMQSLIPKSALQQHIAILGKTGSGKTSTAKAAIVEPLLDTGAQVCILDPTSAWWGLRLAADGKGKGYERVILIGGERGDIPLSDRSGEAVARLITEQGASCVIDTGGMTVGEYTRWFIAFATALYTTIKHPLHLVIDEAHHFMPQGKSPDVDAGRMLHAGNRLMSGGRSRGIRGVLITQRPAKLHKDSLTCADTLIPHRVIAPQDRAAIKDWIDGAGDAAQGKAVLDSLALLARGEAWVWYPEGGHLERVQFPMPKTFDSSKAPTVGGRAPKVGEIDLSAVKAAMAEAVKEAEANDPKLLRARIAQLEREARGKPDRQTASAGRASIERAVASAVAERDRFWKKSEAANKSTLNHCQRRLRTLAEMSRRLAEMANMEGEADFVSATPTAKPPPGLYLLNENHTTRVPQRSAEASVPLSSARDGLQPRHRDILAAIRWFGEVAGIEIPTREMVAAKIGVRSNTGSFANYLGALRSANLITYPATGSIGLTSEGKALAPEPSLDQDIMDSLRSFMDPRHIDIVEHLVKTEGHETDREGVAEALGINPHTGSFANYLGFLRTCAIIDYPSKGRVALTEWMRSLVDGASHGTR
jgi:hypothetical protein